MSEAADPHRPDRSRLRRVLRRRARRRSRPLRSAGRAARRLARRVLGRDRNPLFRPVDRARSMVSLATALLLVGALVAGWLVAVFTLDREQSLAERQLADRRTVSAVTISPAYAPAVGGTGNYTAEAIWTGPDGRRHTATITVPAGSPIGTRVTTWTDPSGEAVNAPTPRPAVITDAVLAGAGTLIAAGLLIAAANATARQSINRRTAEEWAREWTQVEPVWSGRHPHHGDTPGRT